LSTEKNKKFEQSIDISKKLEYYKDAIETALESGNDKLVEDLMRFFASVGDRECFAACLYTCYELIKPDVAMELAWRYDFTEFLMPYMIQTVRDLTIRMDHMQRKAEDNEIKQKKEKEEVGLSQLDVQFNLQSTGLQAYAGPGYQDPYGGGMGNMGSQGYGGMNTGFSSHGNYQGY